MLVRVQPSRPLPGSRQIGKAGDYISQVIKYYQLKLRRVHKIALLAKLVDAIENL